MKIVETLEIKRNDATNYQTAEEFVNAEILGNVSYSEAFAELDNAGNATWNSFSVDITNCISNDQYQFNVETQTLTRIRTWDPDYLADEWRMIKKSFFPESHPYVKDFSMDYTMNFTTNLYDDNGNIVY